MYWHGYAKNSDHLLQILLQNITGTEMGEDAWQVLTNTSDGIILRGHGYTPGDSLYVGIQARKDNNWDFWLLNGYKRYSADFAWDKQPGAIDLRNLPKWENRDIKRDEHGNPYYFYSSVPNPERYGLPAIVFLPNASMEYTIVANKHRIIVITRTGYVTNALYLGFLKPYMQDIHYPYSLAVCGTTTGITQRGAIRSTYDIPARQDPYVGINFSFHFYDFASWSTYRLFTDPGGISSYNDSAAVRIMRPDGTWTTALHWANGMESYITNPNRDPGVPPTYAFRITLEASATSNAFVWPTKNLDTQYAVRDMDNNLTLHPFLFVEKSPHGVLGTYEGMYWVLGDGLARSSFAKVGEDTYAIFHNANRTETSGYSINANPTGKNNHFAVKLE